MARGQVRKPVRTHHRLDRHRPPFVLIQKVHERLGIDQRAGQHVRPDKSALLQDHHVGTFRGGLADALQQAQGRGERRHTRPDTDDIHGH